MKAISAYITRTIDISTLKGLQQAERLKQKGYNELPGGYKNCMVGIDKIMFWLPNPRLNKIANKRA